MTSFANFLTTVEDGDLHSRLSDLLRETMQQLREIAQNGNGRAVGTITLQLGFRVDHDTVDVVSQVASKLPKVVPARTVLWIGEDGSLSRRDPRQPDLPLRDAVAKAANIKTVS